MVPLDADEVEGAAHRAAPTPSEQDWQEVRDILGELSFVLLSSHMESSLSWSGGHNFNT